MIRGIVGSGGDSAKQSHIDDKSQTFEREFEAVVELNNFLNALQDSFVFWIRDALIKFQTILKSNSPTKGTQITQELGVIQELSNKMQKTIPTVNTDLNLVKNKLVAILKSNIQQKKSMSSAVQSKPSQKGSTKDPRIQQNKFSEAQKLLNARKFGQSMKLAKSLLQDNPTNQQYHFLLGSCYKSTQRLPQAIQCYSKAIGIDPDNASYYNNRGNCLLNRADYNSALNDFRNAIRLDPDNEVYINNLANCLVNVGQFQQAIKHYNRALGLSPENDVFYNNRAYAEIKLGLLQNAMLSYQDAINLNPNNAVYYKNMGNLQYTKGEYDAAQETFAKATSLDQKSGQYHFLRGKCLFKLKRLSQSVDCLKEAMRLQPNEFVYKDYYEAVMKELGKK